MKNSMSNETRLNSVYIRFFIRGENLNPAEVTDLLGIRPSYKYERGDRHGKNLEKIRKTGFWSITSDEIVQSSDLQAHIEWLLNALEPRKEHLHSVLSKSGIHAQISCVFLLFTTEWDEQLSPNLLERIAALDILFGISIYSLGDLESHYLCTLTELQ